MLKVEYTSKFKRDLKLAKKRKKKHALFAKSNETDWLLIYKLILEEKVVIFVRTGTHSDLFD